MSRAGRLLGLLFFLGIVLAGEGAVVFSKSSEPAKIPLAKGRHEGIQKKALLPVLTSSGRDPFLPPILPPAVLTSRPQGSDQTGKTDPVTAKKPPRVPTPAAPKQDLSRGKVMGIIQGTLGYRAIVQTGDGKRHVVKKGSRLNGTTVRAIRPTGVVMEEVYTDTAGLKKVRTIVLPLHRSSGREK